MSLAKPTEKRVRIDSDFVDPFIQATTHVLSVQCKISAVAERPFLRQFDTVRHFDIAGILGITHAAFSGTIAICFQKKVFLAAMTSMIGQNFEDINDDVQDGAGEILNMISSDASNRLSQKGYTFGRAIPTVVRGTNVVIKVITEFPTLVLPFVTEQGNFFVEIAFEQS